MASPPSTASSATSPHQATPTAGLATPQTASPAFTTTSATSKAFTSREASFLDAIPIPVPRIVPLEWSIPLVVKPKIEKDDPSTSKRDDFTDNGLLNATGSSNTSSLSASLPAETLPTSIPAYLAPAVGPLTPGAPIASPANAPSTSATLQSLAQPPKPWRIRWATYKAKPEQQQQHQQAGVSAAMLPMYGSGSRASGFGTPQSDLLRVPRVMDNSPFQPGSPAVSLLSRGKGRARAVSNASKASSDSSKRAHKKPRTQQSATSDSFDPTKLLEELYGPEHREAYRQTATLLREHRGRSQRDPLLIAKKQFERNASPAASQSSSASILRAQADFAELPSRLAFVDRSPLSSQPPKGKESTSRSQSPSRLYLFALSSPDLTDSGEYGAPDDTSTFSDLELEGSGTFTASDLFPSLFNDNGIYTAPASMHPASIHPIPSAAALANGQNASGGKPPFFLSSLNISSSSNTEAIAASDAFLKAVEEYGLLVLQRMQSTLAETNVEYATRDRQEPEPCLRKRPMRVGQGLIYPASSPSTTSFASLEDCNVSEVDSSVYVSMSSYFTPADVRLSALARPTKLFPIGDLHSQHPGQQRLAMWPQKGDAILLCPIALPAIFLRPYGLSEKGQSRRQTEVEIKSTKAHLQDFRELLDDWSIEPDSEEISNAWILCSLGDGLDTVWPASHALLLSDTKPTAEGDKPTRQTQLPMRIRRAMAKASSRVPRKLYFGERKQRTLEIAKVTTDYIEYQNKQKNKQTHQTHDKGQKYIVADVTPNGGDISPPEDTQKPQQVVPTVKASETMNTNGLTGTIQDIPAYDQCRPTFESLYAALNSIPGMEEDDPATEKEIASQPYIQVNGADSHPDSSKLSQVANEAGTIYPTPQSAANSINHLSVNAASTETTDPQEQVLSPIQSGNRSLAEIFRDFAWPNYSEGGLGPSRPDQSRPTSAGGAPRGVFDDPSTFGLFDTGGLTDEDFSFFDSPIPSGLRNDHEAFPDFINNNNKENTVSTVITAGDIASFVGTAGPIDHFGHLMPLASNHSKTVASSADPNFGLLDIEDSFGLYTPSVSGADNSATLPLTIARPASIMDCVSTEESSDKASITTPSATISFRSLEHSEQLVHADEPIRETEGTKYSILVQAYALDSGSNSIDLVISQNSPCALRAWQAFAPIAFSAPVLPFVEDGSTGGQQRSHSTWRSDILLDELNHRASKLRSMLAPSASPATGASHSGRQWKHAMDVVEDVYESTSSSATSDNDSEVGSDHHRMALVLQAKPARTVPPPSGPALLTRCLTQVFTLPAIPVPSDDAPPKAANEAQSKINRGEREAVATIFFQHTTENVDFRERLAIVRRKPSPSTIAFPVHCASSKIVPTKQRLPSISSTNISVSHQQAVTSMSISALRAWKKLGLHPQGGRKDVQAVVVAAKPLMDDSVISALEIWLSRLSEEWKISGFGQHTNGLLDDCLFLLHTNSRLLSQSSDLQAKLAAITPALTEKVAGSQNSIIYILVDDAECQKPSCNLIYLCLRLHLLRKGAIPHIVPLSTMITAPTFLPTDGSCSLHQSYITRFAFNVFDRLPLLYTRETKAKTGPNSVSALLSDGQLNSSTTRSFVSPAFRLAPRGAPNLAFHLQWPPPTHEVMEAHRIFHVAYEISQDRRWLYLAAVDDRGEYHCLRVRFVEALELRLILRRVWNFMREASECVSVEWRICISRLGAMLPAEVQAWADLVQSSVQLLPRPAFVTICSVSRASRSSCDMQSQAKDSIHVSGFSLPNMPDVIIMDGQPMAFVSNSAYPQAVYSDLSSTKTLSVPSATKRLYYSLATSSVYFARSNPLIGLNGPLPPGPSTSSYRIDLLVAVSHPSSAYNRQLASHMVDLAQSFVDLYVLGKERWSHSGERGDGTLSHLPWHLAAVSSIPSYDLDQLLPS